jgi:hypothetical protein
MSYLTQYAVSRPTSRRGARVDERTLLNRPAFDGGAHVRVYVEDTSNRKLRRRRLPSPRLKLRIADCVNVINLEFSVDTPELRENSLYKIEMLIAALEQFRAGLAAEAELRALRERTRVTGGPERPGNQTPVGARAVHEYGKEVGDVLPEAARHPTRAAVGADPALGSGAE